jgi:PAS domain S-box-containing protein
MLVSWKQIARHLGISVPTAQRLEKSHNLPVRRRPSPGHPMVFALTEEIDAWWEEHISVRRASAAGLDYREMFTKAPDAMLVVDSQRQLLAANDAACDLLGYSHAAILGMRVDDLLASGPAPLDNIWQRLLLDGRDSEVVVFHTRTGTVRVECRVKANYIPGRHFVVARALEQARREGRPLSGQRVRPS